MIPKIFHFIWIDFNDELNPFPIIPKQYLKNIEGCRKLHTDFEIRIWDGPKCHQLLQNSYPWFVEKYLSFSYPIMRCDAMRFFILHKFGGIYSDLDVKFLKNIEPLLNKSDCVFRSSETFKIGNDFMISRKGSDFIYFCCKNINEDKLRTPLNYHILNTAGPAFLYKQYKKYKGSDLLIIDESILLNDMFFPRKSSAEDYYIETTFDGSWESDSDRNFMNFLRKLFTKIYKFFH